MGRKVIAVVAASILLAIAAGLVVMALGMRREVSELREQVAEMARTLSRRERTRDMCECDGKANEDAVKHFVPALKAGEFPTKVGDWELSVAPIHVPIDGPCRIQVTYVLKPEGK